MRVIVFGAGAVGSVIGGRLHQVGADVVLIARQAHVDAIRANGLRLLTADADDRITVPAVASLDDLKPGDDDVIVITAKTQDVGPIHDAILAWNPTAAVVCGTNGVEHERMALRRFERVYAMVIQCPATFEHPGEVVALCTPTNALIDIGCYPSGVDDVAQRFAALADSSPNLSCVTDDALMTKKHEKLLINLGNVPDAASGIQARFSPVSKAAQEEARAVYEAAGVVWQQITDDEEETYRARRATMNFVIPEGITFTGGSTWQGLAKGSTSTEVDYFNGEICLLGRLHGIATPHNAFLQQLSRDLIRDRVAPGSIPVDELTQRWRAAVGDAATG
jgi:2-dehydropantoate 2-reductase